MADEDISERQIHHGLVGKHLITENNAVVDEFVEEFRCFVVVDVGSVENNARILRQILRSVWFWRIVAGEKLAKGVAGSVDAHIAMGDALFTEHFTQTHSAAVVFRNGI